MQKRQFICLYGTLLLFAICWIFSPAKSFASVSKISQSDVNFTMEYPQVHLENNSKDAEKRINDDIETYVDSFKQDYYDGKFIDGKFSFEKKYEDDNVISLIIIDYRYRGGAHGMEHGICLNYNKLTGEKLGLPYFLRVRPEDADRIYLFPIYTLQGKQLTYRDTADFIKFTKPRKGITDNYFLSGDGSISLVYQPYELSCYAAGITYIYISGKYVDYFNRKNHS